ncbi:MAG: DNA polymerase III subunit gamma/tau [Chloroflexota bacterium]|nr:DNA polymerase III subunit gamma/tau [Chloroflexota bacterium]
MPEQALYLKWRPALFDEMVGQEHITRTLRNALKSGRVRHAYLFSGPRGTGKTTTARLLAKAVNCQHPDPDVRPCNQCAACIAVNEGRYLDLIEIDAATHTGVDDVRDLRDKIAFAPGEGKYKVYIIDEVHRFSGAAFDALLKTLEEPPAHAIFVLATTDIDKVPATIKSRSLQFEFRRFSVAEVADRLQKIIDAEGIHAERAALELIAREGTGSMRDSISLLDQIVTDPVEAITVELVEGILGTAASAAVRELVDAVIARDAPHGLQIIHTAVDSGVDPRQFGGQIVEHLRRVLLAQTAGDDVLETSESERSDIHAQAGRLSRSAIIRAVRAFNDAVNGMRSGWQPQLGLELALLDSLQESNEPTGQVSVSAAPSAPLNVSALTPAQIEQIAARVVQMLPAGASVAAAVSAALPADPPSPPGTPAMIGLNVIQAKWEAMLDRLGAINKQAPDPIRKFFRPVRVEGNIVVLVTENTIYYDRLQDPQRVGLVERALSEVHQRRLHIKVIFANAETPQIVGAASLDPSLAGWAEIGAEIQPIQHKD